MTQSLSSNVRSFGYDSELCELWVAYRNTPGFYIYEAVPADVYDALLSARSKGRFMHEHVLANYVHRQQDG
jgi:hypothetical protein